jgi:hypothetical protein
MWRSVVGRPEPLPADDRHRAGRSPCTPLGFDRVSGDWAPPVELIRRAPRERSWGHPAPDIPEGQGPSTCSTWNRSRFAAGERRGASARDRRPATDRPPRRSRPAVSSALPMESATPLERRSSTRPVPPVAAAIASGPRPLSSERPRVRSRRRRDTRRSTEHTSLSDRRRPGPRIRRTHAARTPDPGGSPPSMIRQRAGLSYARSRRPRSMTETEHGSRGGEGRGGEGRGDSAWCAGIRRAVDLPRSNRTRNRASGTAGTW